MLRIRGQACFFKKKGIQAAREAYLNQKIESDLSFLCEEAKKLGAVDAKAIKASDVVVDPRVALKCRVPICVNYGNKLTCPPYMMSATEFKEILTSYTYAVLVQIEISMREEAIQAARKAANMAELLKDKNYVKSMYALAKEFSGMISKIEALAFNQGYRFASGFSAGGCGLCDECVTKTPGVPCRHPFEARPSMEGIGIDVLKTAEKAGFKSDAPTMNKVTGYGLVLVD